MVELFPMVELLPDISWLFPLVSWLLVLSWLLVPFCEPILVELELPVVLVELELLPIIGFLP